MEQRLVMAIWVELLTLLIPLTFGMMAFPLVETIGEYRLGKRNRTTHGIAVIAPYVLDSQNIDRYPLIQPFNSSFLANYEQEIIPPKVSVTSPLNKTYSNSNISLAFSIDKPFNWIGYSLDGQSNVTINGNTTITEHRLRLTQHFSLR